MTPGRVYEHVGGGRIEIWPPDESGVYGVTLLPDDEPPLHTFRSNDPGKPDDFPETYDLEKLRTWGLEEWSRRHSH